MIEQPFALGSAQRSLQQRTVIVAREAIAPRATAFDRTEAYPWANVETLVSHRFFGMTVPESLGGQGRSVLDVVLVVEEMAKACGATGRIVVEANPGALGAIMAYGSVRRERRAAEFILQGDKPAICITEPAAGSAATEMRTIARRQGDRWILDGRKSRIAGGGISKLHLIFARVQTAGGSNEGIGAFIAIRGELSGLKVGRRIPGMGLRAIPETEIILDRLEVPDDHRLELPGRSGEGFKALMSTYNAQRVVGAAAVALGIAQGAFDLALEHVQQRQQFGQKLADLQGLQWKLADMSIQLEAARLMVRQATASGGGNPHGFPDMAAAARAKIFAAEMAQRVTNEALQLFGANGYGRELPLERMVRDARMFTIGGGTVEILRN